MDNYNNPTIVRGKNKKKIKHHLHYEWFSD